MRPNSTSPVQALVVAAVVAFVFWPGLSVLVVQNANAKPRKISCLVNDLVTKKPLGAVDVQVRRDGKNVGTSSATNSEGKVEVVAPLGKVEILFSKPGYVRLPEVVEVLAQGDKASAQLMLDGKAEHLAYYTSLVTTTLSRVQQKETTFDQEWKRWQANGVAPNGLAQLARAVAALDGVEKPASADFTAYASLGADQLKVVKAISLSASDFTGLSTALQRSDALPMLVLGDAIRVTLNESRSSDQADGSMFLIAYAFSTDLSPNEQQRLQAQLQPAALEDLEAALAQLHQAKAAAPPPPRDDKRPRRDDEQPRPPSRDIASEPPKSGER